MLLIQSLFWFLLALLFAAFEVEIEAKNGWAEKLPTWYRKTGFVPRLFSALNGGNPLTGYHMFISPIVLMIFHAGYVMGAPWSITSELFTLSIFFAWVVMWDFLWFVLNPAYGVKNFKSENIWWHAKSPWIYKSIPLTYACSITISIILAFIAAFVGSEPWVSLANQITILGLFFIYIAATIALAPAYHRWYHSMRKTDDRHSAGIKHP